MRIANLVLFIILMGAAGCASHESLPKQKHDVVAKHDAAMILAMRQKISARCAGSGGLSEKERIMRFWRDLDQLMHTNAFMQGYWSRTSGPWRAMAAVPPDRVQERERTRRAWLQAASEPEARQNLGELSIYQLDLMECYLKGSTGGLIDGPLVMKAFDAFGLGSYSSGMSNELRMDDKKGWLMWASYADACVEPLPDQSDLPSNHREAWILLRKAILEGMLLHLHFDKRPGQRDMNVLPAGLSPSPKEADIKAFAAKHGDNPEALYESFRLMGSPLFSVDLPANHKHTH